ncbi:hypothetical protein H5410_033651 [Solanum commersonii]|uniref:Uncharacterized protein n=1 Tax=Solanum commersonii TaxID=4109 RepID=A0A9J5YP98_SOLCO|nr:hypothetical protein H5410_033651 [Solanum commersonii]
MEVFIFKLPMVETTILLFIVVSNVLIIKPTMILNAKLKTDAKRVKLTVQKALWYFLLSGPGEYSCLAVWELTENIHKDF